MSSWFLSRTELLKYLVTESENHFKRDLTPSELRECYKTAENLYQKNKLTGTIQPLIKKVNKDVSE